MATPDDKIKNDNALENAESSERDSEYADDMPSIDDFFICRDYEEVEYRFGTTVQKMKVLQAASTDYNLTGQVLWPLAHVLSVYLLKNRTMFENQVCVELGAGAGLCGLILTSFAKSVILTDNEPEVLKLLADNVQFGAPTCHTVCTSFDFGSVPEESKLLSLNNNEKFEVLIGSEIIYWTISIEPLFASVSRILSPTGTFIMAYYNRVLSNKPLLEEIAQKYGLKFELADNDEVLRGEEYDALRSRLQFQLPDTYIYKFTFRE